MLRTDEIIDSDNLTYDPQAVTGIGLIYYQALNGHLSIVKKQFLAVQLMDMDGWYLSNWSSTMWGSPYVAILGGIIEWLLYVKLHFYRSLLIQIFTPLACLAAPQSLGNQVYVSIAQCLSHAQYTHRDSIEVAKSVIHSATSFVISPLTRKSTWSQASSPSCYYAWWSPAGPYWPSWRGTWLGSVSLQPGQFRCLWGLLMGFRSMIWVNSITHNFICWVYACSDIKSALNLAPCFDISLYELPSSLALKMLDVNFLPSLPPNDIERASQVRLANTCGFPFILWRSDQLILQAYGVPNPSRPIDEIRRLQQELFDIQKLPEAWGLVIPLLNHQDENVQFFGAHTYVLDKMSLCGIEAEAGSKCPS